MFQPSESDYYLTHVHIARGIMNLTQSPWDIKAGDFPATGTIAEKLEFILGYAVLAPSNHNSQPWLFRIADEHIDLYADRTRGLKICDPNDREMIISCGAALFHLRLAMLRFNLFGQVELFPDRQDPDLLARVWIGYEGMHRPEDVAMFEAIPRRRTNRKCFEDRSVPIRLLAELHTAANYENAWLHYVESGQERTALAELIGLADHRQWADRRFRLELAAWVRSEENFYRDGIPGSAHDIMSPLFYAGPSAIRTFDMGNGAGARNAEIALHSPVLGVLGTSEDAPADWLFAGQALAHVILRARSENVWASFLNQPIELPELRGLLTQKLGCPGVPQMILRLGYGPDVKTTPRRHPDEVLV